MVRLNINEQIMKEAASSHSDIGVWSGIKEERSCELDVEFKNI